MRVGILPLLGIGALIIGFLRNYTQKAISQIAVQFRGIELKFPPIIKFNFFNPTPLKVEITYIKVQVKYKGIEVATLNNTETRIIQPGDNSISLTLMPSPSALDFITAPKGGARTIGITYQVGTKLYEVSGANQATL
jgi:hypothetical protein